ncbi:MAG: hypothetical protein AAFQ38_14930 [Pseudomonadota bacterium]
MRDNDLIRCVFDGQALIPDGNFSVAQVNDRFGAGQVVVVDLDPQRSGKSHKHQFVFVKTAWENLPDYLVDAPFAVSVETLRKHALIATGFCHTEMVPVGTKQRAERVAVAMSSLASRAHGYCITDVRGSVAYCHTAQSQSVKSMGRDEFQKSKQAILEWLADLIGVTPADLAAMGKEQAA